jgi:hypothetical protein
MKQQAELHQRLASFLHHPRGKLLQYSRTPTPSKVDLFVFHMLISIQEIKISFPHVPKISESPLSSRMLLQAIDFGYKQFLKALHV